MRLRLTRSRRVLSTSKIRMRFSARRSRIIDGRLIELRRRHEALRIGSYRPIMAADDLLAHGGARAEAEAQRMISERVAVLTEAPIEAAAATLKGSKRHHVVPAGFVATGDASRRSAELRMGYGASAKIRAQCRGESSISPKKNALMGQNFHLGAGRRSLLHPRPRPLQRPMRQPK